MATWEDVRRIAAALPGAEESTHYRQPAFKVSGKAFVHMSPHEDGALVVHCAVEEQALLVLARPDVYFLTPHYEGYGAVLIRLETTDENELSGAIEDAHEHVSRRAVRPSGRSARRAAGGATRSATRRRRPS